MAELFREGVGSRARREGAVCVAVAKGVGSGSGQYGREGVLLPGWSCGVWRPVEGVAVGKETVWRVAVGKEVV